MNNLPNIYFPCQKESPYYQEEWNQMIDELYTQKLKLLGFTPLGTLSQTDDDSNLHLLKYQHDESTEFREHWIRDIADYQDDGFNSTSNLYFGTLTITIIASN